LSLWIVNPTWFTAPRVGLEPTSGIQQGIENKEVTENANAVLSTGLDKTMQIYPELVQLVKAWPGLPEDTKTAIKSLIETHTKNKK
jgi:S-adenosylhomocysteine hydrolase